MQDTDAGYVRRANLAFEILLQGKWRVQILCAMRSEPVRIGQLARLIPGTSKKILAQHLRRLEVDSIVSRRDLSDIVLHVEYELRKDVREQVCALLDHLAQWGSFFLELRK
jgi:DNA-binding HxlR family transcriptional regulator